MPPTRPKRGRLTSTMLPKSVICLAATAFATSVVLPRGVLVAGRGGGPMEGTWNWPPYAGTEGGMREKTTCGYVWANPYISPEVTGDGFTGVANRARPARWRSRTKQASVSSTTRATGKPGYGHMIAECCDPSSSMLAR
jgi:hypothetical protein